MDAMELVFLIVLLNYVLLGCLMWFVIGKMSKGAVVLKSPTPSKRTRRGRDVDAVEGSVQGGADDDAAAR